MRRIFCCSMLRVLDAATRVSATVTNVTSVTRIWRPVHHMGGAHEADSSPCERVGICGGRRSRHAAAVCSERTCRLAIRGLWLRRSGMSSRNCGSAASAGGFFGDDIGAVGESGSQGGDGIGRGAGPIQLIGLIFNASLGHRGLW